MDAWELEQRQIAYEFAERVVVALERIADRLEKNAKEAKRKAYAEEVG